MGWLAGVLHRIAADVAGAPPIDFTFVPSITAPVISGVGEPIEPDSCYIELYLELLRLEQARRFATRFHGVAYSFVSLPREGEPRAQLTAISKPERLAELDNHALDRVITVSKQMMGPAAFRGGPVSLEFGLFSVKSGNLLTPVLDYVTKVSAAAGNSYAGAVKPFVPLITEGMDLIAGQVQDTALEVGVDTSLDLTSGRVAAILALPKKSFDPLKLSLDTDGTLLHDAKSLQCGYAVFSLRRTLEKADYGEIPELKERYAAISGAIRSGKERDARDALTAFRLAVIASPDLISSDAGKLVERVRKKVIAAFPPGGVADVETDQLPEETLSGVGLYN